MSKHFENAMTMLNKVAVENHNLPLGRRTVVTAYHLQHECDVNVTTETLNYVRDEIRRLDHGAMTDHEYTYLVVIDMLIRYMAGYYRIHYYQGTVKWCGCRPAIVFECQMKGRLQKCFMKFAGEILCNPTVKFYRGQGKAVVIYGVPRENFSPENILQVYKNLVRRRIKPMPLNVCKVALP